MLLLTAISNRLMYTRCVLKELRRLRAQIDQDPRLFTAEVIHRLMLTYRDIQVIVQCLYMCVCVRVCVRVCEAL